MRHLVSLAVCLIGLTLTQNAWAKVSIDLAKADDKDITFVAIGKPSFLKIEGKGTGLSGTLTKDGAAFGGDAVFELDSLDTGLSLRDKHMKEKYLETATYPKAVLKVKALPFGPSETADFDAKDGPFTGELTLHGVTKPVTGTATVSRSGKVLTAHVEFKTDLTDYKIEIPSFKGITVAENVDVKIDVKGAVSP